MNNIMFFSLDRFFFLMFGIIFVSFSVLFVITRSKRREFIFNAAFFFIFGFFYLLLAFWDILAPVRLATHIASTLAGLSLTPIGLGLLAMLFGEWKDLKRWRVPSVVGTLVIALLCVFLFTCEVDVVWPLILCRGWTFACYITVLAVESSRLRPICLLPRQLLRFLVILWLGTLMIGALVVFEWLGLELGHLVLWILVAILFITAAGTAFRYPDIFSRLEAQSKGARYGRSLLSNVDVHAKLEEIERLMREKRLYRDPELDLDQLAKKALLSPHQLSELLNTYAKQNFPSYIMKFRIEQAKRELADPRGATILDIAFDCGFNAKSTFNEAFRKATGKTPSAYRISEGSAHNEAL
jgi:AraC-like DNA-binding protein